MRQLSNAKDISKFFIVLFMFMAIVGCEAPLDLQGVEQVSQMPVKRFDQFQAVAKKGETLIAVGFSGTVLMSTDGAERWKRLELPGASDLIGVVACNDGSFAILDATRKSWISTDGGYAWGSKKIDTKESLTTLTCGPDNKLWIGGSNTTILSSKDKGETWSSSSLGEDAIFTSIQFLDTQHGVATGEFGTVALTKDSGKTWVLGPSIPNDFYPEATLFLDYDNAYTVGLSGKILKTVDGGGSWKYENSGTDAPLYGITKRGDDLYAVGEGGVLLCRKDNRWKQIKHGKPVRSYLRGVMSVNDRQLLIAGGAGALFLVPALN